MSCAVIFTSCVPVERGDCLDKAVCVGTVVSQHRSRCPQRQKISVLGDFQNSAMQGAENPDLTLKISIL